MQLSSCISTLLHGTADQEWDQTSGIAKSPTAQGAENTYKPYNYQQPISCIQDLGADTIKNKLQSRGTIFIYKDVNQVKSKFNTIYGF